MSEFERTKENVGGRSVLMTSWYDDVKRTWRASAPAYSHLLSGLEAATEECASRSAAVACLSRRLASHFEAAPPRVESPHKRF